MLEKDVKQQKALDSSIDKLPSNGEDYERWLIDGMYAAMHEA